MAARLRWQERGLAKRHGEAAAEANDVVEAAERLADAYESRSWKEFDLQLMRLGREMGHLQYICWYDR